MLTIRTAGPEDLDSVWSLVCCAVAHMNEIGNPQWGADYPTRQFYSDDIARGELCLALLDGVPAGVACINCDQAPEYAPLPWTTSPYAIVIHRMAIAPEFQRMGIATALFDHAEQIARSRNIPAFRLDTYSMNRQMLQLLQNRGFRQVGYVYFRNRPLPFPCFEKSV